MNIPVFRKESALAPGERKRRPRGAEKVFEALCVRRSETRQRLLPNGPVASEANGPALPGGYWRREGKETHLWRGLNPLDEGLPRRAGGDCWKASGVRRSASTARHGLGELARRNIGLLCKWTAVFFDCQLRG